LHYAVLNRHAAIVQELFQRGADPIVIDTFGHTPQSLAREMGFDDIADLFDKRRVIQMPKRDHLGKGVPKTQTSPPKPDEEKVAICKGFQGKFWFYTSESGYVQDSGSVYQMLYGTALDVTKRARRWIHLPANNVSLLKNFFFGRKKR
jgi:hypothetical protein